MFEKSLFDLIKGLRNHKGAEEDYIQDSLRECKAEIKTQDMDKKATALLKLIYLEMFGYDMSWASFHVLEVMSSTKYLQKRSGYLAAVQSFRPDTDVLMMATNLLKKDLISSSVPNMSLPLITLPNIITSSLAMSLLQDVLSRISHSHSTVRKKAVVCLYRLSLTYPEALKLAWPKLKDRLMDDEEDSSVTTAVINVVCELGWRRPHDFLPLAPRFFELLVDGGNNWMAIKIIKLFATLTPLEPRLTRKLLRPLMNIIQSTTAMSLLYECINGIIQGGILDGGGDLEEKDEIAILCVGKLRGMIVTDSDPNLKYVALLAFNRVVISYPRMVSNHQDVILDCLDDPDISIRLQALELTARMVTSDTLQSVIHRLISQLRHAHESMEDSHRGLGVHDHAPGSFSQLPNDQLRQPPTPLPYYYRVEVLHHILDICSCNNYSELLDFEWYVEILIELVKLLPSDNSKGSTKFAAFQYDDNQKEAIAGRLGSELRNVAVRVKEVRMEATRAAESIILDTSQIFLPAICGFNNDLIGPLAWILGEYADYLLYPDRTLHSLMNISSTTSSAKAISLSLQAIPKVLVNLIGGEREAWSRQRGGEITLLLARIIEFLETLAAHPDLDVQERAIEFLEVMRLAADSAQTGEHGGDQWPLLLTSVLPSLFYGLELNPVSVNAQRKVPLPEDLMLNSHFNNELVGLFRDTESASAVVDTKLSLQKFYFVGEYFASTQPAVISTQLDFQPESYQNLVDEGSPSIRKKIGRRERNRDDPFYIGADNDSSGRSTPFRQAFSASNESELDIDSIPIIDLQLEGIGNSRGSSVLPSETRLISKPHRKIYDIVPDEMIGPEDVAGFETLGESGKSRRSLLEVDSSGLRDLSLGERGTRSMTMRTAPDSINDTEMATAIQEIERVRLEMQRASERVQPQGIPAEGTMVRKKKKSKKSTIVEQSTGPLTTDALLGPSGTQEHTHGPLTKKRTAKRHRNVLEQQSR